MMLSIDVIAHHTFDRDAKECREAEIITPQL